MISGGFAGGGESSSARKAHLRSIRSADMGEVQAISKLPRMDTTITLSDLDLEGCQHPHDDPLVVRAIVANTTVHRVLVDNGSSADIIFASAFDKMGIGRERLEPVNTHLRGFSGEKVLPLGSIQLVELGIWVEPDGPARIGLQPIRVRAGPARLARIFFKIFLIIIF